MHWPLLSMLIVSCVLGIRSQGTTVNIKNPAKPNDSPVSVWRNNTADFKRSDNTSEELKNPNNTADFKRSDNTSEELKTPNNTADFKRSDNTSEELKTPNNIADFKRSDNTSETPNNTADFKRSDNTSEELKNNNIADFKRSDNTSEELKTPNNTADFKRSDNTSEELKTPNITADFKRSDNTSEALKNPNNTADFKRSDNTSEKLKNNNTADFTRPHITAGVVRLNSTADSNDTANFTQLQKGSFAPRYILHDRVFNETFEFREKKLENGTKIYEKIKKVEVIEITTKVPDDEIFVVNIIVYEVYKMILELNRNFKKRTSSNSRMLKTMIDLLKKNFNNVKLPKPFRKILYRQSVSGSDLLKRSKYPTDNEMRVYLHNVLQNISNSSPINKTLHIDQVDARINNVIRGKGSIQEKQEYSKLLKNIVHALLKNERNKTLLALIDEKCNKSVEIYDIKQKKDIKENIFNMFIRTLSFLEYRLKYTSYLTKNIHFPSKIKRNIEKDLQETVFLKGKHIIDGIGKFRNALTSHLIKNEKTPGQKDRENKVETTTPSLEYEENENESKTSSTEDEENYDEATRPDKKENETKFVTPEREEKETEGTTPSQVDEENENQPTTSSPEDEENEAEAKTSTPPYKDNEHEVKENQAYDIDHKTANQEYKENSHYKSIEDDIPAPSHDENKNVEKTIKSDNYGYDSYSQKRDEVKEAKDEHSWNWNDNNHKADQAKKSNEPGEFDEPSRPEKTNESGRPDELDETNEPDKTNNNSVKPGRPAQPDTLDETNKPNETNKPDELDETNKPEQADTLDQSNKPDVLDTPGRPEQPDTPDQTNKPGRLDKPNDKVDKAYEEADISHEVDKSNKTNEHYKVDKRKEIESQLFKEVMPANNIHRILNKRSKAQTSLFSYLPMEIELQNLLIKIIEYEETKKRLRNLTRQENINDLRRGEYNKVKNEMISKVLNMENVPEVGSFKINELQPKDRKLYEKFERDLLDTFDKHEALLPLDETTKKRITDVISNKQFSRTQTITFYLMKTLLKDLGYKVKVSEGCDTNQECVKATEYLQYKLRRKNNLQQFNNYIQRKLYEIKFASKIFINRDDENIRKYRTYETLFEETACEKNIPLVMSEKIEEYRKLMVYLAVLKSYRPAEPIKVNKEKKIFFNRNYIQPNTVIYRQNEVDNGYQITLHKPHKLVDASIQTFINVEKEDLSKLKETVSQQRYINRGDALPGVLKNYTTIVDLEFITEDQKNVKLKLELVDKDNIDIDTYNINLFVDAIAIKVDIIPNGQESKKIATPGKIQWVVRSATINKFELDPDVTKVQDVSECSHLFI